MPKMQEKAGSLVSGGVRCLSIPIHVPFTISRESLAEAQIALVELQNGEGLRGLGECAPFPSLTYDTVGGASKLALQILDEIRSLDSQRALAHLRGLREEIVSQSITAYVGVESALWDLTAREAGVSLASLWGAGREKALSTDITLPIMAPEGVGEFWDLFAGHGFPIVKVKVSGHLEQDLALIDALLRVLPKGVELTLDGNQGYELDAALRLVDALAARDCRPLFFEQPLPEDDHQGLARLSSKLSIPVCVDETVRTLADAQKVIEEKLAHMINVKIMKSGIEEALAIIACARKAQIPLMIGGMLESEVAAGISLQMALGTDAISFADLDTPFFFKQRVAKNSAWDQANARLEMPKGPGHGMEALTKKPGIREEPRLSSKDI